MATSACAGSLTIDQPTWRAAKTGSSQVVDLQRRGPLLQRFARAVVSSPGDAEQLRDVDLGARREGDLAVAARDGVDADLRQRRPERGG
jgi:hypothetical protein